MQDGIIQRLLHDTCPASGYDLCQYQNRLPHNANAWLWGEHSLFFREGGFSQSQTQDDRMILDSLERYPLMNVKAALYDSVLQFFEFKTGDGIESQVNILRPELAHDAPRQLSAYLAARQQRQRIRFETLNMIHVTVGMLSCWAASVDAPCRVWAAMAGFAAARPGVAWADRQRHHLRHLFQSP